MIAAGVSSTVSALAFVYATRDRQFIRDFWIRAIDPTRIGGVWWLAILGSQVLMNVVAIMLSSLGGGAWGAAWPAVGLEQLALSEEFLAAPIGFLLFILVFGPIPEELGWRDYGLDALRSRMNLLQASVILAGTWAGPPSPGGFPTPPRARCGSPVPKRKAPPKRMSASRFMRASLSERSRRRGPIA